MGEMRMDIPPKYLFLGLIVLGTLFEVAGDILFKKWSLSDKTPLLIAGLVIYFIGTVFWAFSLKQGELARAASIFTILNLVLIVAAGFFIFHEEVTLWQRVGIGLGLVSVALIEFF